MTLQSSGPISLSDIATEFGGSAPHTLSEYYGVASGVPASGQISIQDFYGKSAASASYVAQQFVYQAAASLEQVQQYGNNCGVINTVDGGFLVYGAIMYAINQYTNSGYMYARGISSALALTSYHGVTNTNIRSVSVVAASAMKTVTDSAMIAWISASGSTPYANTINLGRVTRVNSGSTFFVNSALSMASLSTSQYCDSIGVACNTSDNVLVAYGLKANTSPFNMTVSYVIRSATCTAVKAATSLATYTGANARVICVASNGTDFFVFYYSYTNSAYGVVKINSTGTTHTNINLSAGPTITPWSGNCMHRPAINGTKVVFPYGRGNYGFCLTSFDMSNNQQTYSPDDYFISNFGINDGQACLYVPNSDKYVTLQSQKLRIYSASTLVMDSEVQLTAQNGLEHFASSIALRGTNEILIGCGGPGPNGMGLYLARYTI